MTNWAGTRSADRLVSPRIYTLSSSRPLTGIVDALYIRRTSEYCLLRRAHWPRRLRGRCGTESKSAFTVAQSAVHKRAGSASQIQAVRVRTVSFRGFDEAQNVSDTLSNGETLTPRSISARRRATSFTAGDLSALGDRARRTDARHLADFSGIMGSMGYRQPVSCAIDNRQVGSGAVEGNRPA